MKKKVIYFELVKYGYISIFLEIPSLNHDHMFIRNFQIQTHFELEFVILEMRREFVLS